MKLNLPKPLVSVEWLSENLDHPDVVILNATIRKVTDKETEISHEKLQIKNARFFDIKNNFSDTFSQLPNTFPKPEQFQKEARKLGINTNSLIVVYDDYGFYSCARAWWLFKAFGHENVTVLDGGFPEWTTKGFKTEKVKEYKGKSGDFIINQQHDLIKGYNEVLSNLNSSEVTILDARSEDRFSGEIPEPREGLRSGHIPNSKNLPYSKLIENKKMISDEELKSLFNGFAKKNNELIFTCGSGVTACILALGADKIGYRNISVYDGSWTEWGGNNELPIETGK